MARRGFYRADKRRKELKRLKKQEEKRKRKLAKLEGGGEDLPVDENGDVLEGAVGEETETPEGDTGEEPTESSDDESSQEA